MRESLSIIYEALGGLVYAGIIARAVYTEVVAFFSFFFLRADCARKRLIYGVIGYFAGRFMGF